MDSERLLNSGMGRALLPALPAHIAGVALQLQQQALDPFALYGFVAVAALVGCVLVATRDIANRWSTSRLTATLAVFLLAFGWASTGARAAWQLESALSPALEGRDIDLTGVVVAMPQRNEAGLRLRLRSESATLQGLPVAIPALIDVAWYGGVYPLGNELVGLQRAPVPVQAGERWRMTVRLKAPHGSANPYGFDYELYLWEQGVGATGYVRAGAKDPVPRRIETTWQAPVARLRQQVRERIVQAVPDRQQAGLIAALTVGDQAAIDRSDWDVFRATGVAHLVSISGLHITMFAWAAAALAGVAWRRSARLCMAVPAPVAALWGGLLLASAYAVFAGWGIPAQRTCIMLLTVAVLRHAGLRWPWPVVWILAGAVVVLIDPWALLQVGFWLSFVAVGVLYASDPSGERRWQGDLPLSFWSQVRRAMHNMARTQIAITLALAPLTLLLFGQISVAGLIANVVAIPWVTLMLTPLSLGGVLLPQLWSVAALAADVLMQWLQWLAAFQWAVLSLPRAPLWVGLAAVAGSLILVFPWAWWLRLLGLPLVVPVFLWHPTGPMPGEFSVLAADIGQGNAVLVRTATHALLFDAGPRYSSESDAGHRVIVPLLQAQGLDLDALVLSHRDNDHVGGAQAVMAMQPQSVLWSSLEDGHPLRALRPGRRCMQGQSWEWDGVRFDVLHPLESDYGLNLRPNALSCVVRVSNGRQTALLTGDIEAAQEERLVRNGAPLRADVLLVPHHGSKTSSTPAFLDAVQPRIALVQSGYRNRFGHPSAAVVQRYEARGIRMVESPRCGAALWQSWQTTEVTCQREESRRYWHHRVP